MDGSSRGNLLYLPMGDDAPEVVHAVIEVPCGGRNKIEYDKQLQTFRLDRVLHSSVYYPGDYGFVPRTLAEDGDPLDVLVLVSVPTFSGCLMAVRPIGYLNMIDQEQADQKILAVPVGEPEYEEVVNITDIAPHTLRKIAHFFETYKLLEEKHTSSEGWHDAESARDVIRKASVRFQERVAA
jgi:inorganic pyrophosphatase